MTDNKYLIISDLDGTLLNNEGQLTQETIDYVKKITEEGHLFCIATGRPLRGALRIYNELGIKTVMANNNGSTFTNPTDNSYIPINLAFSSSIAKQILHHPVVCKNITNALVESDNVGYMIRDEENPIIRECIRDVFHIDINRGVSVLDPKLNQLTHGVNSILLVVNDIDIFDEIVYYVKGIAPTLVIRRWSIQNMGYIIEINSSFADKSLAMGYLSSYYGIPKERIIAFGDGDNDMNMLNSAAFGFAMKNGTMAAKLSSRHITKFNNNENGVIWELRNTLEKLDK